MIQQNRGKRRSQIYNRDERADDQLFFQFKECLKNRLAEIKTEDKKLYSEISNAIADLFLPPCKISYKKLFDIIKIMEKDPSQSITFKTLFDLSAELEPDAHDIVWDWTDRSVQRDNDAGIGSLDRDFVIARRNQKIDSDIESLSCVENYVSEITGEDGHSSKGKSIAHQMHQTLCGMSESTLKQIYTYLLSTIPEDLKELASGEERCRPTMRTIYTLDRLYGQTQRIVLEDLLGVTKVSGSERDSKRSYSVVDIMRIANYTGISPHWLFACDTQLDFGNGKAKSKSLDEDCNCEIKIFSQNILIERIMDIFTLMNNKQRAMLAYSIKATMADSAE